MGRTTEWVDVEWVHEDDDPGESRTFSARTLDGVVEVEVAVPGQHCLIRMSPETAIEAASALLASAGLPVAVPVPARMVPKVGAIVTTPERCGAWEPIFHEQRCTDAPHAEGPHSWEPI